MLKGLAMMLLLLTGAVQASEELCTQLGEAQVCVADRWTTVKRPDGSGVRMLHFSTWDEVFELKPEPATQVRYYCEPVGAGYAPIPSGDGSDGGCQRG